MLGLYEYSLAAEGARAGGGRARDLAASHAPVSADGVDIYLGDLTLEVRKGADGMLVVNAPCLEAERVLAGLRSEEIAPEVEISSRLAAALTLADNAGVIVVQEHLEEAVEVLLADGESMRLAAKTATSEIKLWALAGLDSDLSLWIARNPLAPPELLAYLARTQDWLRAPLAQNPALSMDTLYDLAVDCQGDCHFLIGRLRARGDPDPDPEIARRRQVMRNRQSASPGVNGQIDQSGGPA